MYDVCPNLCVRQSCWKNTPRVKMVAAPRPDPAGTTGSNYRTWCEGTYRVNGAGRERVVPSFSREHSLPLIVNARSVPSRYYNIDENLGF